MDDPVVALIIVLGFFCVLGGIVSSIASKKGRSPVGWFLFGAFFFVPAVVTALLIKPNREYETSTWIRSGGRLCEDCREPVNPGAIRCHHCGVLQSERAPEQLLEAWELAPRPDNFERSIQFFAEELKNVHGSNILGNLTLDERALLSPLGASPRLASQRAQHRCQRLVDEAMTFAVETSQWADVEGTRMPQTWVEHYLTIADHDDGPALVAFIERSFVAHESKSRSRADSSIAAAAETEIAYGIDEWTREQFAWITLMLDQRSVGWVVEQSELIVAPSAEADVDALIAQMTGERPTDVTWRPPGLPPLGLPPPSAE